MDSARSHELKVLLDQVLDVPPAEREAFLDEACGSDHALRSEVQSMLDDSTKAYSFFERLAQDIPRAIHQANPSQSITDARSGTTIGRYQILEKLGGGGMGVVFRATDTYLDRPVALKFLPDFMSYDEQARQRFIQEAKTASSLDHPNICTVHEIGETQEGHIFIAMACYEGETLKKKIEAGPLPLDEAVAFTIQVCRGLAKAHAKGIVHRDIKPANVMVTEDGVVKILDFGLAKASDLGLTRTGEMMGTAAYMSPEQASADAVDYRTDIWSVGVMLYEMMAGRRPFADGYLHATIYAVVNEDPIPLRDHIADIPEDLEHIVMMCLEKSKDLRYPSVNDLLADLEVLIQGPATTHSFHSASLSGRRQASAAPLSIAVLPFLDMSPDKDQEYFSDGITEELNDALAKVGAWRVVSRTSAFAFKGKELDIRVIGKKLNASHVLEGSIRKAGNHLRIRAQLVSVRDGFQLWSEKYSRELEDIFAIQEDIAHAIVKQLKVQLADGSMHVLVKRPTRNLDAYTLYLKARFHLIKRTEEGLKKGQHYCEQALTLDPNFCLAYAGLADAFILQGFQGTSAPTEVMPRARAAAEKAIALDDTLAEAYTSLGCITSVFDWDWSQADALFQQAIALVPSYSTAFHWYATWCLWPTGRFDEALVMLNRAQVLDPLSLVLNASLGWHSYFSRQFDASIEALLKTLELQNDFVMALDLLGQAYLQKGCFDEAIGAMEKAVQVSERRTLSLSSLGHAYACAGRSEEATQVLHELHQRSREGYVSSYDIALIYTGLGHQDDAFHWLERAYDEHSGWLGFLNIEPRFDSLRGDPRFTTLLQQVRLG